MPTQRGWLMAGTGVVLFLAGAALATRAIEQIGLALILLAALAVFVVRLGRHEITVTRTVAPERVGAGRPVRVTIDLANDGRGSTPLLLVEDKVPPQLTGKARFAFSGIEPAGRRRARFELRPQRRGRYEVGPLEIMYVDPFGLARVVAHSEGRTPFLVHPRIERLSLPRDRGERRSLAVSARRQPTGATGEDFYTLREYVEGDDLRKIHWPSTAKRGRYMIRQEETPWHTRATIVLDDRSAAHEGVGDTSSFERSVEAAAALADLYTRSGYTFRLVGAHDAGLAPSRGSDHFNRCLDVLSTIQTTGQHSDLSLLTRLAEIETAGGAEGSLTVVTGALDPDVAAALGRCRRRFRQIITIAFPAHRFGSATTKERWEGERRVVEVVRLMARSGIGTVVLAPGESLAIGWSALSQVRQGGGEAGWDRKPELV